MKERSISVMQGKGNLMHNNRTYEEHGYKTPDHIDTSRTHLNKTFIKQDMRDAYKEVFGDAIEEYNAKQKRSDRRIKGIDAYIESIRADDKKKLFYETVVQIGDMEDCNAKSDDGKLSAHFLEKYIEQFQKANPNIKVFNAVLHMDEQTPHLHIDWFPIARGYQRGLQVQQSLAKGLEQQGVKMPDGEVACRKNNLCMHWYEQEKRKIADIMKDSWEMSKDKGVHRNHESVEDFKRNRDIAKRELAKHKVEKIKRQETGFGKQRGEKVIVLAKELDELEERARIKNYAALNATKLEKEIQREYKDISSIRLAQEQTRNNLERMKDDLECDRQLVDQMFRSVEQREQKIEELPKKIKSLEVENTQLKENVNLLNQNIRAYQQELDRKEKAIAPLQEQLLQKDNEISSLKAQIKSLTNEFKEKVAQIGQMVLEGNFEGLKDMFKPKVKTEFICKSHNYDIYKKGKDFLVVKGDKVTDIADTLEHAKHKAYVLAERGR